METSPATHVPGSRRGDVVAGADLPADAAKGTPAKRIRTSNDIAAFNASETHAGFKSFLWQWSAAVQLVPRSAIHPCMGKPEDALPEHDAAGVAIAKPVRILWDMLRTLRRWMAEIPLTDMHEARFGNPAYRDWHDRLKERCGDEFFAPLVDLRAPTGDAKPPSRDECIAELTGYLLDSFGNATRIDYGSGHELHFVIMLYVLTKMGVLTKDACFPGDGDNSVSANTLTRQVVLIVFWGYIDFMRDLQRHYRMEPAGSHGVWGLDDFHHIPFVIGASQLYRSPASSSSGAAASLAPSATEDVHVEASNEHLSMAASMGPSSAVRRMDETDIPVPSAIVDAPVVERMRNEFIYFEMIGWIRDHKRGPFHEHSSVLYNVSGLDSWGRIANGMMKMFDGEVLQKINIVQHLLFGHHFPFVAPIGNSSRVPPNAAAMMASATRMPAAAPMTATAFPGKGVPPPTVAPGVMPGARHVGATGAADPVAPPTPHPLQPNAADAPTS